jgi:hypothetical protein
MAVGGGAAGVVGEGATTAVVDAMDALAAAVRPTAMAVGAAAAMAAGLGMPWDATVANDILLRVPGAGAGPSVFPGSPPASHLHAVGPDSALAAAIVAARAAAAEGRARVRAAALAWERERDAADALDHQIAEAEQLLVLPTSLDVGSTSFGSTGHRVSHTMVI